MVGALLFFVAVSGQNHKTHIIVCHLSSRALAFRAGNYPLAVDLAIVILALCFVAVAMVGVEAQVAA